jgi:hypothetical protein
MKNQKAEFAFATSQESQAKQPAIVRELLESELLYVGGGTGNVIFNQPDPTPQP